MAPPERTATQLHTGPRLSGPTMLLMLMIVTVAMALMTPDRPALFLQAFQRETKSETTK